MVWIKILVSLALVLSGKRLFWFFVGAVGFILGISLAARFMHGQPEWVILMAGIIAGVIGSMLAVSLQRLAIFIGGFLAGAFILVELLQLANIQFGDIYWLVLIIGGIVGAIFISNAFDWAVILLSSLAGSLGFVQAVELSSVTAILVFLGLLLAGIIFQSRDNKDKIRR